MQINIQELEPAKRQSWLQHSIAPRPIAFASTIDKNGNVNLSPFSFFNLFSANPPILIFSPARRVRDNSIKHTLENVLEIAEVGINICDYDMVQQMSVASCDYPKGVDEFEKSGFTKQASSIIKPPLVAEAKIKFECKVIEVKSLGENKGAGQLVIAEVLMMYVDESILTDDKQSIDQTKINLIARLGGDWYCQTKNNLFKVPKPNIKLGIGVDALPQSIRTSKILSGNDLGILANIDEMPVINASFEDEKLKNIVQYFSINPQSMEKEIHLYVKELLQQNEVEKAWQVLLMNE
ncbi:MAG: flavin reductase family protein [Bacteroidetes bacterium]|nr:flavin reductase family protein [Bacteroidota bacterium]